MKLNIAGPSNFANRMFQACGNYQWAREFLKNSLEAKASRVEFGIEWQAVGKLGVFRRCMIDDGEGMNSDELVHYFSTLGEGAKKIGGLHDNFGVGAKVAALPWNPEGVVVVSYKDGFASMIEIMLDPASGEYELKEWEEEDDTSCVIDPASIDWTRDNDIDWSAVRPNWVKEHGTIIVLKGSKEAPDTVLGNPQSNEADGVGISFYLNSRFWDLSGPNVEVIELRNRKKNRGPLSAADRYNSGHPNTRRIMGAKHFLTEVTVPQGKLGHQGEVWLDKGRVKAEWYLWEGERPAIGSYARKGGYIAARYSDELYELSSSKAQYRRFGVSESEVQQKLTIVLEPQHFRPVDQRWGVHPEQSRNRLIFCGGGEKGIALPIDKWGLQFAEFMPSEICEAIHAARCHRSGSIQDGGYRKRLQDKFGDRWKTKLPIKNEGSKRWKPVTVGREPVLGPEGGVGTSANVIPFHDPHPHPHPTPTRNKSFRRRRKTAIPDGEDQGVERNVTADVPRYRIGRKEDFESPQHLALWAPNDPDGPTVFINAASQILEEVIQYHQNQYPDIYAEEVAKVILGAYGEVAACKIAHSNKLLQSVSTEMLNRDYRSEPALTLALMGLLAEESLISQRLAKFRRKKVACRA